MASVSGIFFFRQALPDRAELVIERVEFDTDGLLRGHLVGGVTLLLDELGSHFGGTQARVETRGAKRGIGLALRLNDRLNILQEMG